MTPALPPEVALAPDARRRYERLQRLSWLLDSAIRVPLTRFRFGLDPLLGLVPGLGDALGAAFSAWIVMEAARFGVSRSILLRMLFNVVVDTVIGDVPLVGDAFDFAWKSDAMNLALLHRHLVQPEQARAATRRFLLGVLVAMLLVALGVAVGAAVLLKYLIGLLWR